MQLKGNEGDYVLLCTIISCAKGPFTRLSSGLRVILSSTWKALQIAWQKDGFMRLLGSEKII